ncbi:uncharacterized protein LOC121373819 [Gigantopelta aegis]|uniref:uncharacterized protein LOC121373819 n=1 Tax=Gigantopelta aegis TaxID=1735272 RepID=UPI001B88BDCB|nr:uncharacterized protein LOC121373819 [Gigantopelta aegis]
MRRRAMAVILPLQHLAELASVFSLLDITHDSNPTIVSRQVARLNANYYASVSEKILKRITLYYKDHMTDRLLLALAPPSLKELWIDSCSQVTTEGVIAIFHKCHNLQLIDLSHCDHLISVYLFESISRLPNLTLSAIIVEECDNVTDQVVQCMLKGIPNLRQLKLGSCRNITDDVFLIDKQQQNGLEMATLEPVKKLGVGEIDNIVHSKFLCRLVSVDVSGCNLTSTAVRHLTTLTGPTLREVDISCSKIDPLAMWYLCGFSFPAAIKMLTMVNPEHIVNKLATFEQEFKESEDRLLQFQNCSLSGSSDAALKPSDSMQNKSVCDSNFSSILVEKCQNTNNQSSLLKDKQTLSINQSQCASVSNDLGGVLVEGCENSVYQSNVFGLTQMLDADQLQSGLDTDADQSQSALDTDADQSHSALDTEDLKSVPMGGHKTEAQSSLSRSVQTDTGQSDCVLQFKDLHAVSEREEKRNVASLATEVKLHGPETDQTKLVLVSKHPTSQSEDTLQTAHVSETSGAVGSSEPLLGYLNPDEIKLNLLADGNESSQSALASCQHTLSTDQSERVFDKKPEVQSSHPMNEQTLLTDQSDRAFNDKSVDQWRLSQHVESLNTSQPPSALHEGQDKSGLETSSAQKKLVDQLPCPTQKQTSNVNQSKCVLDFEPQMSTENVFSFTEDLMPEPVDFPPRRVPENVNVKLSLENVNLNKDEEDDEDVDVSVEELEKNCGSKDAHKEDNSEKTFLDSTEDEKISMDFREDFSKSLKRVLKFIASFGYSGQTDKKSKLLPFNFRMLYSSDITSFSACHINVSDSVCNRVCVGHFFYLNGNLKRLELRWKSLSDMALSCISDQLHDLRNLSLVDCDKVSDHRLHIVGLQCQKIEKLDLKGVCFFDDEITVPFVINGSLSSLSLSESHVTDSTLDLIHRVASSRIVDLDCSWCEDLTEEGVNLIASCCSALRVLNLRHCPATDKTLDLLADNCNLLENIELSGVQDITDVAVVNLVSHLPLLQVIDISWNFDLTDPSIVSLFLCCPLLRVAKLSGLKRLTSDAFTPIISDYSRWRKCQALFQFKNQERHLLDEMGEQQYSSDEEYDALYLPHRSTVYAPSLQELELEYCNYIDDDKLQEIVGICHGSLTVIDYYCQKVVSSLSSLVHASRQLVLKQGTF